jgi:PTS system ascorbate-specific IIA component
MSQLSELLTESTIRLNVTAKDWEDALRLGTQLLIDTGGVETEYIDAMLEMIHEMGPYVVIAPGLVLGHSRPDAGVNRTCFSLITLKEPVEFGVPANDPIDVVFSFAAPNKDDHIEALRELATMCSKAENMTRIRSATEAEDILSLLVP